MTARLWTTFEARLARELRWEGATHAQIGRELDRTEYAVRDFLLRNGWSRTRHHAEHEAQMRRALPMLRRGVPLRQIAHEVGWTKTRQALHSSLQRYEKRIGRV